MANIKFSQIYCILILIITISSCTPKVSKNFECIDDGWKRKAMFSISEKYMKYKETHDLERKRYSEVDLFIKFEDIDRYPFGIGIDKLKRDVELKKIKYDSIVCRTKQTSKHIDPGYLYPNYYFLFENGKIKRAYIFNPSSLELSISTDSLTNLSEIFQNTYNKIDGDDQSLIIFTTIKPNWEFEIGKIIINSY